MSAANEDQEPRSGFARLLDVVIAIAAEPPAKPSTNAYAALVGWRKITELRDALDAVEIEWRTR
jgi:hypothetical protein